MKALTFIALPLLLPATLALADEPTPTPTPAEADAPAASPADAPVESPAPAATATESPAPTVAADAPAAEAAPIAEVEKTAEPAAPAAVTVNVFASTSYSFNFNRPMNTQNQIRVFDTEDGTAQIDVAEVVLQRAPSPGDFGFRVDMVAGSAIPHLSASAGLFRDEMGVAQDFDLQQAYVSYVAKGAKNLRLDVGKFITHMGWEVIDGYDGYNDHYTRSFLFGYAIPFTHTGLKVSVPFTSKVTGALFVVNGWDNVRDNNDTPSIGAQLLVTPTSKLTLYLNYIGGAEQNEGSALRQVGDVCVGFKATEKLGLALNATVGSEAEVIDSDGDMTADASALWWGVAAYAKAQITGDFSLALRGEIFDDADGYRTGAAQQLIGVTLTPSYAVASGFVVRGDLRFDSSDADAFMTDDGSMTGTQVTAAVNVLAAF